jgi:hypothetical protein
MRRSFTPLGARTSRTKEGKLTRGRIGSLWIVRFFGLVAAETAQTQLPPTAGGPSDGTYRFVSSSKVNVAYVTRNGQMGQCPDRRAGPLHVAKGRARYTTATGYKLRGTVGTQGELAMRVLAPPNSSNAGSRPIDIIVNGSIDGAGTARVLQSSHSCSYDFVWQKSS